MNEIRGYIKERINDLENGSQRLKALLATAEIEKDLLNIATYENISFCTNGNSVKQVGNIEFDRLSMVHPPSFVFSVKLQIAGYFNVKYKSAKTSLPMHIEPFDVNYSGIAIQHENELEIKNESIKVDNTPTN